MSATVLSVPRPGDSVTDVVQITGWIEHSLIIEVVYPFGGIPSVASPLLECP